MKMIQMNDYSYYDAISFNKTNIKNSPDSHHNIPSFRAISFPHQLNTFVDVLASSGTWFSPSYTKKYLDLYIDYHSYRLKEEYICIIIIYCYSLFWRNGFLYWLRTSNILWLTPMFDFFNSLF